MIFNKKAQGALEYLLLIGAAILIVAVVIVALSGIVVDTKDQNSISDYNSQFEKLQDLQKKPGVYGSSESIAKIVSFKVEGVNGLIQEENIIVTLPYGTSLDDLQVEINANGIVNPSDSEIDFELDSEKIFTVTSIDNKNQKDYVVVINYALSVDEDPPIINLIYPISNQKIYEENLTFEFSVVDDSQISNCTLSFNSNNYTWSNISSETYQKAVTLSLENEGINIWSVSCVDSENNSSEVISESFELIFDNDSAQVVFLSVGGYGGNIQNDSIQITLPNGTDLTNLPFNVVVENGVISPNESKMSFNLGVPKNFTLTSSDST
ncbi:MAG: class III signal peptide-containing protein, partial [Candidatus ainarchaeum sp.]|nr:class III signal peptide-containing protein [Candidatus ainarchaeum sp.]